MVNPIVKKIRNAAISTTTIVGPTGVSITIDAMIPIAVQTTEIMAEQMVTDLNDLKTLIALKAGKIMRAEISNEPTRFIAKTMIIAVIISMTML